MPKAPRLLDPPDRRLKLLSLLNAEQWEHINQDMPEQSQSVEDFLRQPIFEDGGIQELISILDALKLMCDRLGDDQLSDFPESTSFADSDRKDALRICNDIIKRLEAVIKLKKNPSYETAIEQLQERIKKLNKQSSPFSSSYLGVRTSAMRQKEFRHLKNALAYIELAQTKGRGSDDVDENINRARAQLVEAKANLRSHNTNGHQLVKTLESLIEQVEKPTLDDSAEQAPTR